MQGRPPHILHDFAHTFGRDLEGRITFWTKGAERVYGWTEAEARGQDAQRLLRTQTPETLERIAAALLREGEWEGELARVTRDGREVVVASRWELRRDGPGGAASVLEVGSDVTARRRDGERLREGEEQFRVLFENSRDAAMIADDGGNYLEVNRSACELMGYTREQLLRMKVSDLVTAASPDAGALYRDYLGRGVETGEFSFVRPDGGRRVAQYTAVRIGPDRHLSILRDLTEMKRAEEALRESEDRYRDLVENSHELMCTHDLEGRILSVNPWAARVLGYDRDAIVGMNIRDGLLPERRAEFDEYIRAIKRDGFARGVMQVRTATGQRRFWEYHNTLRTQGVESPVVRGMAHDVTERRQALAREKEARAEAEEASRLKDEFLATLSHELRTPLTAILGWAKLLSRGEVEQGKQRQALETIARNAAAQAQLIEDLLDVSRIITGKLRLDAGPVELASVVSAAADSLRPAAEAKGVGLRVALDPEAGLVSGDADRLQQVVWNLLSNAVKFTPGGGGVEVRLRRADSHVEVAVSDTGQGIDPQFLPHVFDRFRQADQTSARRHGGLGLGLSIVRHLVELHGGSVDAESGGPGAGATFRARFPLMNPRGVTEPPAEAAGVGGMFGARPVSAPDRPALEGVRVLVVDDERDARDFVRAVLERCGAEVSGAATAREALEGVEGWRPDVLVCDIGMPGEDGYSLIARVRSLPPGRGGDTPAAALTAYARDEDRERALAAGFQAHLSKPVGPEELAASVARLAGRVR